ncbi:unnamed protein product, partial [Pylaiella littoralis]
MTAEEPSVISPEERAHEFSALNTLLLVVVLGLCILSAYLIRRNKFYYLPESAAAILVGVVVGGMAKIFYPTKDELDFLSFNSELFYFLLLPPIIFEAGYTLRKKDFFHNILSIVMFAVLGTLVSTFIIGYLTYLAGKLGLARIDTSNPMEPLLFGALISAVDPVATLSIMGSPELNCDPLLYSLVFGESVLNDAVAIVLFRTFLREYQENESFTAGTLPSTLWSFFTITLASTSVGVLIGLACSFLFKHTRIRDYPKFEISLLFLSSYGSYAFAEAVELSGIMSIFFTGVVLATYNTYNLSPTSQITAEYIFASLATLSEFVVFLYMGMGVFTGRFRDWDWRFIGLAIVFCLVARLFNTFPFSALANLWRHRKITANMQVVMWFAGLRGAIAFALSTSMPGASKDVYASTTLMVVIFTTIGCGGLTEPLLHRMNVKIQRGGAATGATDTTYQQLLASDVDGEGTPPGSPALKSFRRQKRRVSKTVGGGVESLWRHADTRFLKPLFGGSMQDIQAELAREAREQEMMRVTLERKTSSSVTSSAREGRSRDISSDRGSSPTRRVPSPSRGGGGGSGGVGVPSPSDSPSEDGFWEGLSPQRPALAKSQFHRECRPNLACRFR